MQNAGLAINLASAVSCVWHSIYGTILAGIFAKIDKKKEQT